jgi:hypothetical protein
VLTYFDDLIMGSNPAIAHKPLHADFPIRDVVLAVAVALVLSGRNASNPKPITNYSPKGRRRSGLSRSPLRRRRPRPEPRRVRSATA